jgi:hypothetical protein
MELSPTKIELWLSRTMELYRGRRRWRLTKEVEWIVGLVSGHGILNYNASPVISGWAAGEVDGTKQASVE